MELRAVSLGIVEYKKALSMQERLLELRQKDKIPDTLLLLEHPPVITLGRRGITENILVSNDFLTSKGIKVHEINRGGDVTYHGPGQLVGYPIMDLTNYGRDIHEFVWKVEEVFIEMLKTEFHIQASRGRKKYTGVWVGDKKITAIGVAVKQWVTMHGFAFNVNTQLAHFKWIVPCGICDKGVTSLSELKNTTFDLNSIKKMVLTYFSSIFQVQVVSNEADNLLFSDF